MASFNMPHDMSLQQLTELQQERYGTNRQATNSMEQQQQQQQQQQPAAPPEAVENNPSNNVSASESGGPDEDVNTDKNHPQEQQHDRASSIAEKNLERGGSGPPNWLNNAVLRQSSGNTGNYSQWNLSGNPDVVNTGANGNGNDLGPGGDGTTKGQPSHGGGNSVEVNHSSAKGFLELHSDTANSGGGDLVEDEAGVEAKIWHNARLKADIVTHPLYEQLLSAHISCLRTATPVDQLPKIDAQVGHSHQVAAKYALLATDQGLGKEKDDVNEFMAHYVTLLRSFKEQLQQHVRVHAMEAVVACWELEQSLFTLTGVSPGEGTGATMSEDEDEQADSDSGYYDASLDGHDYTGFGPLIPTETERTLMERVRHELKIELKHGYKAKINDVREEILRKRRAGKLPGDTTSVLKSWWHAHSKWPYPSEDDKARLVQETGLELKQINNWFINQRKRNWHSNPSSSTSLKNKRKR